MTATRELWDLIDDTAHALRQLVFRRVLSTPLEDRKAMVPTAAEDYESILESLQDHCREHGKDSCNMCMSVWSCPMAEASDYTDAWRGA